MEKTGTRIATSCSKASHTVAQSRSREKVTLGAIMLRLTLKNTVLRVGNENRHFSPMTYWEYQQVTGNLLKEERGFG